VFGCLLLYTIMRRGGQAVMRRRFSAENIARVERAYARFGFLALAVPALLPPPMPFKIFVATAGALEYPRWRFVLTVMIARSVRYIVEGTLAVFYGERVLRFMRANGLFILSVVGGAPRRRRRRLRARQAHTLAAQERGRAASGARPSGED
jgi:membrane protein DedA with SNARE-associated domain